MPRVNRLDLEMAFDFVSAGAPYECNAYISRATGMVYWVSDHFGDDEEDLPDDLGEVDGYIEIPHKNELDLGKRLVMRFVGHELPDEYDEVDDMFSHRGAYSRYKDLLEARGKLQVWYDYEERESREALQQWCDLEGIELVVLEPVPEENPKEFRSSRSRVMYIEDKSEGLEGKARIGRVYFSKTGKTLYYRGMKFRSLKGNGFKANYFEVESGQEYWISGPRKDQNDRLYGGNRNIVVDSDVKEEYAAYIRRK